VTSTRRDFVRYSLASAAFAATPRLVAQGVATHTVKPVARPAPSGRPFYAHFVDVAAAAGLRAPVVYGGVESKKYILESVGCGCAFIDFDNDGWMDIFLLSGTRLDGDPPNATNRLYKNNRDGTFTDVTEKAGLKCVGWASGVCIGDYNNDGFEDIFCTYFGQNHLYRNNGDGTFMDVTRAAGLWQGNDPPSGNPRWGAGCSFLDYDRDGLLDLFVSNYVQFSLDHAPAPGENVNCNWKGVSVECGPRGFPRGRHSLYHNNGDGTFTDVSQKSGIASATESYGMTVVAADFDEDGWTDIFVACDSTPSLLFMNNHDGTFREEGVLRGVALSDDGMEQAGMGVGVGDYNLDGHLDLFKTHFADDANGLYRNDGKGNFDDLTQPSRLAVDTRYLCWGAGIVDLDNDGYPDLFMTTGNVYPEVERKLPQYGNKTPRAVFRNLGNQTFEELIEEAGPGVAARHCSRGCAFGDFDNDGDIDILIINLNEPPSLLRNDIKVRQNWIKIKLQGVKSNRSGIGARVLAHYGGKVQAQAVLSQSSFYSCNDPRLHFGLGAAASVDFEVYWPSGAHEQIKTVPVNRLITVKEGSGVVGSAIPPFSAV
jgi:enediyne biosynthesis protein E4